MMRNPHSSVPPVLPPKPLEQVPLTLHVGRRPPTGDGAHLCQLVLDAARGSETSFEELYDRTHLNAYGVAMRILRSPDHAVEVTQEAYLELWLKADSFDPSRGTVMGWLLTIVRRRAIDRVRNVTSAAARELRSMHRDHVVESVDVSTEVVDRIDAQRVRGALARLTTIQREAVRLKYFEDRTLKDIASELDLPISTVKSRLRDGMLRLRSSVELQALSA